MEETRYRKVFITGALGFIGRALMARYQALGAQTCGLDVRADPAAGVIRGNVTRPEEWQGNINGSDLVIHTAAIVTNNIKGEEAWRVNVLGTRRVLDAAIKAGARRFVHISSLAANQNNWTLAFSVGRKGRVWHELEENDHLAAVLWAVEKIQPEVAARQFGPAAYGYFMPREKENLAARGVEDQEPDGDHGCAGYAGENPVFRQLTEKGVAMSDGTVVKLPPPILANPALTGNNFQFSFQSQNGVPYVVLSSPTTGPWSPSGQMRTRLEAFLEMLQNRAKKPAQEVSKRSLSQQH